MEVVGGLVAESLALLADAVHMLSDAAALGLALGAAWLARRPPTRRGPTAIARAEILAALANGAVLVGARVWIFVEAGRRLGDRPGARAAGCWVGASGFSSTSSPRAYSARRERERA